jgi:hypothetical protein
MDRKWVSWRWNGVLPGERMELNNIATRVPIVSLSKFANNGDVFYRLFHYHHQQQQQH